MSYFHFSVTGALIPTIVKKAVPKIVVHLAKVFNLKKIGDVDRERIKARQYPKHYGALYALWIFSLLGVALAVMFAVMIIGANYFSQEAVGLLLLFGVLNFFGSLILVGGLIDAVLWSVSSERFRDYVMLKQMASQSDYVMEDQIKVMLKIGALYYAILIPIMIVFLT